MVKKKIYILHVKKVKVLIDQRIRYMKAAIFYLCMVRKYKVKQCI